MVAPRFMEEEEEEEEEEEDETPAVGPDAVRFKIPLDRAYDTQWHAGGSALHISGLGQVYGKGTGPKGGGHYVLAVDDKAMNFMRVYESEKKDKVVFASIELNVIGD